MKSLWDGIQGYKTYFLSIALILLGVHLNNADLIVMGLAMAGLRHGITTEVAKIAASKKPLKTAEEELPTIADVLEEEAVKSKKEAK